MVFATMSGFGKEGAFESLLDRPATARSRQALPHDELEKDTVVGIFPHAPVLRATAGDWAVTSPAGHERAGRTIVHVMNVLSSLDVSRADRRARAVLAHRLGSARQPRQAEGPSFTPVAQDAPQERATARLRLPWRR